MSKRKVAPIRPGQARIKPEIPDVVIGVFNQMISRELSSGRATVFQDEVVQILVDEHGLDREEIFKKHYLDVEDIFREAGWKVEYDKPGYNESYRAHFIFTDKEKRS